MSRDETAVMIIYTNNPKTLQEALGNVAFLPLSYIQAACTESMG